MMLHGRIAILRAPEEWDLDFLKSLRNDFAVQSQLLALPRPNSPAQVREWIQRSSHDPLRVLFVITRVTDDEPIGFVQLAHLEFVHGHGELGIAVAETARGSGVASEALRLLEQYVTAVFGLRKIHLRVLASNGRAIELYLKNGYQRAGVLREHFYHNGRYHDLVLMEKLLEKGRPQE